MACKHENHSVSVQYSDVTLFKCDSCGLFFNSKIHDGFDPKTLYESYYKNEISTRFNRPIEFVIRMFRFFRAFKIFTINSKARTILDIGSGRGYMLYYLKKYYAYKRAAGTQLSKPAVQFSREKLGLEIYDRDFLEVEFEPESFDIVTLWHVLEHLKEPEKYIKRIHTVLSRGGSLVIEVPNYSSWTRKLTGRYWLGLDPGFHMYFFTPESLSDLLMRNGFKVQRKHTFSLEYSIFISVQSIVSRITRSDQEFFNSLQDDNKKADPFHLLLFILLCPVAFLINILLYPTLYGEVLLITAEKD